MTIDHDDHEALLDAACSRGAGILKELCWSLFRVFYALGTSKQPVELQLDDSSFQADRCGVGSIMGSQLRKDGLDSTLDGFLGDLELIRDLLIGISGCDQA